MSKTAFTDGDPSLGQLGTVITAAFLTALQNHRHDGQDQDNSCPMDYAADTGVANAYVVSLTPALTSHIAGLKIIFKAVNANTAASTINFNGLGNKTIVRRDGTALQDGDIPAGAICPVAYDGANYQLLSALPIQTTANDATYADNSTKPASTNWVRGAMSAIAIAAGFASSFAGSGYVKFPSWLGGWIIQWGQVLANAGGAATSLTFPTAFPSACYQAVLSPTGTGTSTISAWLDSLSTTGGVFHATANFNTIYIAIGK
jgi:hypothetical protein